MKHHRLGPGQSFGCSHNETSVLLQLNLEWNGTSARARLTPDEAMHVAQMLGYCTVGLRFAAESGDNVHLEIAPGECAGPYRCALTVEEVGQGRMVLGLTEDQVVQVASRLQDAALDSIREARERTAAAVTLGQAPVCCQRIAGHRNPHGHHDWVSRDYAELRCEATACQYNRDRHCMVPSRCQINGAGRCEGFTPGPCPRRRPEGD